MKKFDWNAAVKEALDRTEFMALSTQGRDGIWTCPVQFGYDGKLRLYFKSMPASKHMQNLLVEEGVSAAIFSTQRFPDGEVCGLQMRGVASFVLDRKEVEDAARHYYGRDPLGIDYATKVDEHVGADAKWNFVRIIPTEAWYFDSRRFGEHRQRIDLDSLELTLGY